MMTTEIVDERMQGHATNLFYHEHVARYRFAAGLIAEGWTLDIATGSGYGAQLLSRRPGQRVIAADVYPPTLWEARASFGEDNVSFMAASGTSLPLASDRFKNVVSLETVEHIEDGHGFVAEIARVMTETGLLVMSTPDRAYSERHRIVNPYHVHEYYEAELRALLRTHFLDVTLYYQGYSRAYHSEVDRYKSEIQARKSRLPLITRLAIDRLYRPVKHLVPVNATNMMLRRMLHTTYPQPELTDIVISEEPVEDASVFVAVCRQPRKHAS